MKKIHLLRPPIQTLSILLSLMGFWVNFQFTMAFILVLTLFAGAYFCGWICPYGTFQDIFSKLGKTLGIKKYKMPKSIQGYLVYSRYVIFLMFLIVSADWLYNLMSFDPRANLGSLLSYNTVSIISIIVIFSFGFIALFFDRPFCNYLCVEGAKYGLMSSLRIFTVKRNETTCVNCKKCDKVCPMNIEVSKKSQQHSQQCINCFECIASCPVKNTLTYGKIDLTPKTKKRYVYYSAIIALALSIFLGYMFLFNSDFLSSKTSKAQGAPTTISSQFSEATTTSNTTTSTSDSATSTTIEPTSTTDTTKDTTTSTSDIAVTTTTEADIIYSMTEAEIAVLGDAGGIADGVYSGLGSGFKGNMTVEVTVMNQLITKVEVVNHRDDRKWFNRANNLIPESIIDNQSTEVNVVSGATFSSLGIIEGARAALDSAR